MNYQNYSVEDFVWDEHFRSWILSPDPDLNIYWNTWMANNPDKKEVLNAARRIITGIDVKDAHLSDEAVEAAISDILRKIETKESFDQIDKVATESTWGIFSIRYSLTVAASLVLFLSVVGFYFLQNEPEESGNMIEKVNNGPGLLKLSLHDGTKITLEKGARVSFSKSFTDELNRKIYLTGEAFFDVAKNPSKPFIVYSNGLITKVLGTQFRIRSFPGEKSSAVEVTSGIVSVYSLTDKDSEDDKNGRKLSSLILTRNQRANYSNEDRTVMATIVEQPIAINNKVFNYTFSDTPIKQIFENIEEGYGIEIIYDEKELATRTLTADLSQVSMYDKLSIICRVLNTHYEIIDGKILIYPN